VEAAVQAVKNSYYETLEELAAAYAVYIVQGHVFMDGNKRSGAAALATFLVGNGRDPKISPTALKGAMLELQQRAELGERTDVLIAWLADQI
jgi:death-on-curing family protein